MVQSSVQISKIVEYLATALVSDSATFTHPSTQPPTNPPTYRLVHPPLHIFQQTYSRKSPFIVYMIVQGVFLCVCCAVVNLKPPEFWACRIAWGAVGGCLQGNVYMLKAASSMAVIDFGACMTNAVSFTWLHPPHPLSSLLPALYPPLPNPPPCHPGTPPPDPQTFWLYTWVFIFIAATGLLVNALAMRYYKATFCGEFVLLVFGRLLVTTTCGGVVEQTTLHPPHPVCSFVGWYNVSAAAASAAFFGSDVVGVPLILYVSGEVARRAAAEFILFTPPPLEHPSPAKAPETHPGAISHPRPHSNSGPRIGARGWRGDSAGIAVLPGRFERRGRCVASSTQIKITNILAESI